MAALTDARASLHERDVQELRGAVRGVVIREGDSNYQGARRVWNGRIDKRPAAIVRCAGAADAARAVRFARERNLPLAIRSGGHHVAGLALCDGGIVVDLSRLKGIRIDPARRTAVAQPGLTWGEYQQEAQALGLATPAGVISTTGIAGLTLGGGIGWLMRKYGLTIDNLLSVDLVTADGDLVRASEEENADLFWAVRGAGANFGVVTALEYRLQPVSTVVAGVLVYPMPRAGEVLRAYREFAWACPDDLTTMLFLATSPEGLPAVIVAVCHVGSAAQAEADLRPLRGIGPLADQVAPMPFGVLQSLYDHMAPVGLRSVWRSGYLDDLRDDAIEVIVERAAAGFPTPMSLVLLNQLGGAVARVGPAATAYPRRSAGFAVTVNPMWSDAADSERCAAWADDYWRDVRPFTEGVYVNYLDDEGEGRARSAYGDNYPRLAAIKRRYDPTNVFRVNHNIRPAGE